MCIFSHESIEKSLPHNLQEPNSRGDVNAEDGEEQEDGIDLPEFCTRKSAKGLVLVCKVDS